MTRRREVMAEASCPVILMHAQGDPKTMQLSPHYDDVALDVHDWLEARIEACVAAGIARERIIADPGIGFGKSFRHNLDLLRQFTLYHGLGRAASDGAFAQGFHRRAHRRKTCRRTRAWLGWRRHMVSASRSAHSSCA
jgi:dihydropteroate synthase